MGNTVLSDIEEGEILDDEANSLEESENNEVTLETEKDNDFHNVKYNERSDLRNDDCNKRMPITKEKGYMNERLRKMLKLTEEKYFNPSADKRKDYICDFIFSHNKYKSDSYKSHLLDDCYDLSICKSGKKKKRKAYVGSTSGSAEDIMSQIDKVVCRKNRCNYKRRRRRSSIEMLESASKNHRKCSWEKFYEKQTSCSHGLESQKSISSYMQLAKNKKSLKSKLFQSDSSPERNEILRKKLSDRKRMKCDDDYYGSDYCLDMKNRVAYSANTSNKTIRDFDEVRKIRLEKLKKEREQERMREDSENVENSAEHGLNVLKIQKVEKINNSWNSMSESNNITEGDSVGGNAEEEHFNQKSSETLDSEAGGDNEMDLRQLRLIALASNKRRKNAESVEIKPSSNVEGFSSPELKSDDSRYDGKNGDDDLDRNELLLRAMALKTALMRKHQKLLHKKASKTNRMETSSDNDAATSCSNESNVPKREESSNEATNCEELSRDNATSLELRSATENDGVEENTEKTSGIVRKDDALESEKMVVEENVEKFVPCNGSNETYPKDRIKRKRKKSAVSLSEGKENGGQETFDEDCQSLRSQLLHDLIRKKSQCTNRANKSKVGSHDKQTGENVKSSVQVSASVEVPNNFQTSKFIQSRNSEIQRIIVHLGSDDSSDDDADDKISSGENQQHVLPPNDNSSAKNTMPTAKKETDESAMRKEYEKKVMQLLGEARRKIEGEMPEAIYKHLSPSQRLEYIRLKQKIAEREKCRKTKSGISSETVGEKSSKCAENPQSDRNFAASNDSNSKVINRLMMSAADGGTKNAATTVKTTALTFSKINRVGSAATCKKSFFTRPAHSVNETTGNRFGLESKICAKKKLAPCGINNASKQPIRADLPDQVLIRKLKFLLAKIKIEKTMEKNYEKEISIMKSKLVLLEKKRNEQRFKIKKLADESVRTYKLMQSERMRKASKTEAEVRGKLEMKEVDEKSGRVENEERPNEKEAEKEITVSDCRENPVQDQKVEETSTANGESIQYNSPLEVFGQGSEKSAKVDPNVIMCQFDLMGICRDEECTYQHVRKT